MGPHNGRSAQQRGSGKLEGRRILVVEDDWYIAEAMSTVLENAGAHVVGPAASVAESTKLAKSEQIDVAVMDLNLQGEMADELVTTLTGKGVKVVVVTAYDAMQSVTECVFATLQKPVSPDILIDTLCRATA
jgi:CheY-like chemotaxis protein